MNDERRLKPRYNIAVPIDVEGVRGVTRNLSINGVIFVIPLSLETGREIKGKNQAIKLDDITVSHDVPKDAFAK